MTVDRPTPISSGYLKAFSTGRGRGESKEKPVRDAREAAPGKPTASPPHRGEPPPHPAPSTELETGTAQTSLPKKMSKCLLTQFLGEGGGCRKKILSDNLNVNLLFRVLAGDWLLKVSIRAPHTLQQMPP